MVEIVKSIMTLFEREVMSLTKGTVVHITTVHTSFDTRIFYKECKSLVDKGLENYLIHTEFKDFDEKKFKDNNIKPILIKKQKKRIHRMFKSSKKALEAALKIEADIYHIHDPELLLITSQLKKTGATVIYDMHEDYYTSIIQKKYIPKPLRFLIANAFTIYERIKTRNLIIVLAEKYYGEKYPEGVPVLNYPILQESKTLSFEANNRLLYTGNVTKDRGANIHAIIPSYVKGITVRFVGRCAKTLATEMMQHAGKQGALEFHGIDKFIPREEIDKEYTNEKWLAGLAIFPPTEHYKKKELTKFLEYMNAGLPIIASDFPEWRKFIEKHKCGILVKHDDNEQIKAAIDFLKNNPDKGLEMAKNGQNAVLEELNWNREAEKLAELYEASI